MNRICRSSRLANIVKLDDGVASSLALILLPLHCRCRCQCCCCCCCSGDGGDQSNATWMHPRRTRLLAHLPYVRLAVTNSVSTRARSVTVRRLTVELVGGATSDKSRDRSRNREAAAVRVAPRGGGGRHRPQIRLSVLLLRPVRLRFVVAAAVLMRRRKRQSRVLPTPLHACLLAVNGRVD